MKIFTKKVAIAAALMLLAGPALAAINISVDSLISAVIWLVVAGLIYWLCMWLLGQIGVPDPFNKVIRVIVAIIVFVIVINVLLGLAGSPLFSITR